MTDPFAPPPGAAPTPRVELPLYGAPLPVTRNGLGTAALVLGVLSVPMALLLAPAVLAICFGIVGRRRAERGQATNGGVARAGALLGAAGLVVGLSALTLLLTSTAGRHYLDCQAAASTDQAAQQVCQDRLRDELLGK